MAAAAPEDAFMRTAVGASIHRSVALKNPDSITVGGKSVVGREVTLDATHGPVSIGRRCTVQDGACLNSCASPAAGVRLGNDCSIGAGAVVVGSTLGAGVQASGCVLKDGVVVQEGAVLAPGFVAAPGVTLGGVPAKVVATAVL